MSYVEKSTAAGSGEASRGEKRARVFILDDHPLICEGLARVIECQPDMVVCGQAHDVRMALTLLDQARPEVLIVDISLKGESGIEFIRTLRASGNRTPILAVSMHREDLYCDRVLRCGGQGYVMKEEGGPVIVEALRKILDGGMYVSDKQSARFLDAMVHPGRRSVQGVGPERLSPRELEIVECVGRGMTSAEIAKKLHISARTVETHRTHIKDRLGVRNRTEMLHSAIRWVEETPAATPPAPQDPAPAGEKQEG